MAVGAHEDEVVEGVRRELDASADQVLDDDRLGRHRQAHDVALARPGPALALLRRDPAARAGVAVGPPGRLRRLALGLELLGRLEGAVGLALAK